MKLTSAIFAAIAAQVTAAAAIPDRAFTEAEIIQGLLQHEYLLPPSSYKFLDARAREVLQKRQAPQGKGVAGKGGLNLGNLGSLLGGILGGGAGNSTLRNAPKSTVPEVQEVKPEGWPQAKAVKVRYGPYRMIPTSERTILGPGMSMHFTIPAKKPCDKDCTILALKATIEYADGKEATNAEGAWFHHSVLINTGPKVVNGNCGTPSFDNMFMSGNERSTNGYALPNAKLKSGYKIHPQDTFVYNIELMNQKDKEQWVWLATTYYYLDGHFADWKDGRMLWMSIGPGAGNCGARPDNPWGPTNITLSQQPKSEVFSEHSAKWTAPRDGWLLATGGHMHDGGESLVIFQNKDVVCKSEPKYGHGGHGMGGMKHRRQVPKGGAKSNEEIPHIDKQEGCMFPEGKLIKKGDTMHLQANYDFKKFPGMKNDKGDLDGIMGIVGSVVAF